MSKDFTTPKTADKASLPLKEPEILKKWERKKFSKSQKNEGKESLFFTMAPYANGHHMGTALSQILEYDYSFSPDEWKRPVYVPGCCGFQ